VKHLSEITVLDEAFKGFWVDPAYRIPDNDCACVEPGTKVGRSVPIGRYNVRSFITSLAEGAELKAKESAMVKGIAFDGGYGITEVLFSAVWGKSWREAELGRNFGKYSFREWTAKFRPEAAGNYGLKVKATNRIGQSQPAEALWNPAGYMRNVVETVNVKVV
jgi:sulfite dehydrogenase (cytochrome) subunit A